MASTLRKEARTLRAKGLLLTNFANEHYLHQDGLSGTCDVQEVSDTMYHVKQKLRVPPLRRTVDFEAKTCTCLRWQQWGLPCSHVLAAWKLKGGGTMEQLIQATTERCWRASTFTAACESLVIKLPDNETSPSTWTFARR